VPLWNHAVSEATFETYSSSSLDAADLDQPDGESLLCLSCHDGTVAIDAYGGNAGGSEYVGGAALIGTGMSNQHPISFQYTDALASTDGGLHDPTTTNSGLGGMIDEDLLYSNKLQCPSCHDVHDLSGFPMLLRVSIQNSELCLTCHNK
jgi:predicted CXXCH cytochrome family protein